MSDHEDAEPGPSKKIRRKQKVVKAMDKLVSTRRSLRKPLFGFEPELLDIFERNVEEADELPHVLKNEDILDLNKEIQRKLNGEDDIDDEITEREPYERFVAKISDSAKVRKEPVDVETSFQRAEMNIQLPKLELPKFAGDVLRWPAFWSTFSLAIHNRDCLCAVDKFTFLRASLTGAAFRCIEGLIVTNENYKFAVERLTTRFGQTKQFVQGTIASFDKLIAPKTDGTSLRYFFDEVEVRVMNLESLGIDIQGCSPILVPKLVKLLPQEMQFDWICKCRETGEEKLKGFIEFLQEEVKARELWCLPDNQEIKFEKKYDAQARNSKWERNSSASLNVNVEGDNEVKKFKCQICSSEDHPVKYCNVKTVVKRLDCLRAERRCFNCLAIGHLTRDCRKEKAKCNKCNGSHNIVLCYEAVEGRKRPVQTNEKTLEQKSEVSEVPVNIVAQESVRENILLQSLVVRVAGQKDHVNVRIIFSGGSQRSFVSERLSRRIGAVRVGQEDLSVSSFGNTSKTVKTYPKVEMEICGVGGENKLKLNLLEINNVCSTYSSLPSIEIERWLVERGFYLAEQGRNVKVEFKNTDVIISADYYWKMVTGKIHRLNKKLVAVETIYGWVLSGPENMGTQCSATNEVVMNNIVVETAEDIARKNSEVNCAPKQIIVIKQEEIKMGKSEKATEMGEAIPIQECAKIRK